MSEAETYARYVAHYEALAAEAESLRAENAELRTQLAARTQRVDEALAERDRFLAERDHAMARLTELETEFRTFGSMVVDVMRRREPSARPVPLFVVPEAPADAAERAG